LKKVRVPGEGKATINRSNAPVRIADFLEFAELMCIDALERDESCGGHFREEHQTPDGEAQRDDENFAAVFAWNFRETEKSSVRNCIVSHCILRRSILRQRSYK